jgi:hypothetical protein
MPTCAETHSARSEEHDEVKCDDKIGYDESSVFRPIERATKIFSECLDILKVMHVQFRGYSMAVRKLVRKYPTFPSELFPFVPMSDPSRTKIPILMYRLSPDRINNEWLPDSSISSLLII